MKLGDLAFHGCRGTFLGLALFGAMSLVVLWPGGTVPSWLLLLALPAGWWTSTRSRGAPLSAEEPAPKWLVILAVTLLAAVTAALIYGSLASPSRHWDGVVSWEPKALFLATAATLDQPFFSDPAVFCHSRDYPLLQPLLIGLADSLLGAGNGRLLFGALFMLLAGTVGVALRVAGASGAIAWTGALAAGLTPALVNDSSGAFDSGYADCFLALAVVGIAAGLLLRDGLWLLAATALGVFVKPEGMVYGALPALVLWCTGSGVLLRWALVGWLGAAALWWPVGQSLHAASRIVPWGLWLVILVLGSAALFSEGWVARRCWPVRKRVLAVTILGPVLLVAVPFLVSGTVGEHSSLGIYLTNLERLGERIWQLPELLGAWGERMLIRGRFAGTFWVFAAVLVMVWRRDRPWWPGEHVVWFVVLGLCAILGPFLVSPEQDLEHHIKSSMGRLILHWVGAAWLVVGAKAMSLAHPPALAAGANTP